MKPVLLSILAFSLFNFNTFANDRDIERRIRGVGQQIQRLIYSNLDTLSMQEKRALLRSLTNSKMILTGRYDNPNPTPVQKCSNENMDDYKRAFLEIKTAAYSSSGLGLSNEDTIRYAQSWALQYPCSYARNFGEDLKSIRIFSTSSNGLNLSKEAGVQYTKGKIGRFCGDRRFRNEFMTAFSFAYSSSGLNLPKEEARRYAKSKMEARHFVCRYGDHLQEDDRDDYNGGNPGLPFPIIISPRIEIPGIKIPGTSSDNE